MSALRRAFRVAAVAALLAPVAEALVAQQPGPAAPPPPSLAGRRQVGDTSMFAPLPMPAANEIRGGGGQPGSHYWQNRASYDITAALDTARQTVSARMRVRYQNNSPDTLRFLWFQTEQNAFQANSLNSLIFPQTARFGARDFQGGDVIERFVQMVPSRGSEEAAPVDLTANGTMTKAFLAAPLAPGAATSFDVAWHFLVPEHGADRMGRDGALYEIAQWYPRLAVYDDVSGWNTEPYLGQGEFYLEYGDFSLALTVPAGYVVAATGMLQNPEEVLTAEQRTRLAAAAKADTVVRVITADELKSGKARPRASGTLTWRFSATGVRDAVWAAAPDYQWDATSWQPRSVGRISAFAYYRPRAAAVWSDGADQARMSIQEYSDRWFPYLYPQISAVEGPISGMEYPMVAMESASRSVQGLYDVVTHEIGHMWFPMMVGSNERLYMWQDEGFNTFINTFSEARRYPDNGDQMQRAAQERATVENVMRRGIDEPMIVEPDRVNPGLLGVSNYTKPSVGLQLLRQEILGPDMFDAAFKEYIRRWVFKHPTPWDFFRTMDDVSGRRLDWFWRGWFLENALYDQGIDTVTVAQAQRGDTLGVAVRYANKQRGVLPIRARFTFTDGSTQDFVYPAEVWSTGERYVRQYFFPGKQLAKVEIDPDRRLVDVDRSNNVWTPPAAPPR